MYSLEDIFNQAWSDNASARRGYLTHKSVWYNGVKMVKTIDDEPKYTLENIGSGGEHYIELTDSQVDIFMNEGWRQGCYNVAINNYESFIINIQDGINKYEGKNESYVKIYKKHLEETVTKLNQIKSKL